MCGGQLIAGRSVIHFSLCAHGG